jgi:predicted ArsR family transcriptional regulator
MRRQISHYVDRPILLRAVRAINETSLASAKAVAEELRIRQEDARELLAGEVTEGFLVAGESPADCTHRFVVYRLTERGKSAIGAAA